MSYDLMVFDPAAAPREREAFMRWYQVQTKWSEGHSYDDPAVSTPSLQAWFHDMRVFFPAMNGPFQTDAVDDPTITDHCIGRHVVYVGFQWPAAESAYVKTRELATKHQIGFFDVSANEDEILFPSGAGA